jgi:hypothetical protein
MMKRSHLITLIAVVISAGVAVAQQQQTPLGDVVRQNKPTKKAARVITDEDMPSRPQPSQPESPSSSGLAPAVATDAAEAPKSTDKDAAKESKESKPADKANEDSAEVAAIKSRLKELATDIDGLQKNVQGAERGLREIDDPERRQIIENSMKNRQYSLNRALAERAELTQKLEDAKKPKPSE